MPNEILKMINLDHIIIAEPGPYVLENRTAWSYHKKPTKTVTIPTKKRSNLHGETGIAQNCGQIWTQHIKTSLYYPFFDDIDSFESPKQLRI